MSALSRLAVIALAIFSPAILKSADDPKAEDVVSAMEKAVSFYREKLSVDGGYASGWTMDPLTGHTEHHSGPTVFSIQPHGTTTVGLAMLHAWQATGEKDFLEGAIESGRVLARSQLASGGWASSFDFDPKFAKKYHLLSDVDSGDSKPGKRRNYTTLDDNKSQSALLLLLELAVLPETKAEKEIQRAWKFGIDSLLAAQRHDGGWPQQFNKPADQNLPVLSASYPDSWPREWPKPSYVHFVTLNDSNLYHVMHLLLRAHELADSKECLAAAKRLGDFFLRAQMPKPQPAWAQQYSDDMHPVWARKFEPPAISSVESLSTAAALLDLYTVTGDERYRDAMPAALDWLASSQLENGKWARFYELKTNRPLYCEAETYKVTYDDSNLPTHYGFQVDGIDRKVERLRDELAMPHETLVRRRKGPTHPDSFAKKARSLRGKVKSAMKSQHSDGYWKSGDTIEARDFVKHMNAMSEYVDALKRSKK